MKKVLIQGATGMLGTMVLDYLNRNTMFCLAATYNKERFNKDVHPNIRFFKFDAQNNVIKQLDYIQNQFQFEYIINAIGIINKYCMPGDSIGIKNAIRVNSLFPYLLSEFTEKRKIKVIQIATDCVFSGSKGNYIETDSHDSNDPYGQTKSLGEVCRPQFLNIRCSIIGPETARKLSLLEWYLNQDKDSEINGFDHHYWNGITTLQFAQLIEEIIINDTFNDLRELGPVIHYIKNESVTKYELLNIFNNVFEKNTRIQKYRNDHIVDRTLNTILFDQKKISMHTAISDLKKYMQLSTIFGNSIHE